MRNQLFKLEKYCYGAEGGSLKLISKTGSQFQVYNGYGDGTFNLFILRSPGWGPKHFVNEEDYLKQEEILKDYEELDVIILPDLLPGGNQKESDCWKVMFYDIHNDYEDEGIELTDTSFIHFYRNKKHNGDMLIVLTNK